MAIPLLIVIIHLIFGLLIENIKSRAFSIPLNILLIFTILVFTVGITYTADWYMYEYMYEQEDDTTDFVFYSLSKLFNKLRLPYDNLFIFHLISTLLIYFFLITKFTRNYFYVFLVYILLDYVHLTNQIRYYLGFPILLTGFYYLFYKKNYIIK